MTALPDFKPMPLTVATCHPFCSPTALQGNVPTTRITDGNVGRCVPLAAAAQ